MKTRHTPLAAAAAALTLWALAFTATAQHEHHHGAGHGAAPPATREVLVDGLRVGFHVMANAEHRKMLREMKLKDNVEPESTHNITVTLAEAAGRKPVTGATVGMKVVDPRGGEQIRPLSYNEGLKGYEGYFRLPEKGTYEFLVVVRIGEERKTAGVSWELK
ncbi:MAG: hypothetical protein WHT06_02030 [Desulfobacterales bacterium]